MKYMHTRMVYQPLAETPKFLQLRGDLLLILGTTDSVTYVQYSYRKSYSYWSSYHWKVFEATRFCLSPEKKTSKKVTNISIKLTYMTVHAVCVDYKPKSVEVLSFIFQTASTPLSTVELSVANYLNWFRHQKSENPPRLLSSPVMLGNSLYQFTRNTARRFSPQTE